MSSKKGKVVGKTPAKRQPASQEVKQIRDSIIEVLDRQVVEARMKKHSNWLNYLRYRASIQLPGSSKTAFFLAASTVLDKHDFALLYQTVFNRPMVSDLYQSLLSSSCEERKQHNDYVYRALLSDLQKRCWKITEDPND